MDLVIHPLRVTADSSSSSSSGTVYRMHGAHWPSLLDDCDTHHLRCLSTEMRLQAGSIVDVYSLTQTEMDGFRDTVHWLLHKEETTREDC